MQGLRFSFAAVAKGERLAAQGKPCTLLKLPVEIRNQMYNHLLTWNAEKTYRNAYVAARIRSHTRNEFYFEATEDDWYGKYCDYVNFRGYDEGEKRWFGWSSPEILRVCPQIYAEVTDLVFRNSTIDVELSVDGIGMLLQDQRSTEASWHMERLRRFDFALLEGLNISIRIDACTNSVVVLRLRNVVSSFVTLLNQSLGDKKLQTLRVEVCGQLECIIFGDPAEEYMKQSFSGLAPDVVLILGPLSLLRISHKAEVFYPPCSQRTFRPDVLPDWSDGLQRLLDDGFVDLPDELWGSGQEAIEEFKIKEVARWAAPFHRVARSLESRLLSTLPAVQDEDTSIIITRSMEQIILTLTPQLTKAFRVLWVANLSTGSAMEDDCDGGCDCHWNMYTDEEKNDLRSNFEKNKDRLVDWVRRGWTVYLQLDSDLKEMLQMPEQCLREIWDGK